MLTPSPSWLGYSRHSCNSDIDDPIPAGGGAAAQPDVSPEQIAMLADMGFTSAQAKKALIETVSAI